ncbi:uncharacterized protein LACBIDRAFT_332845 [Laccaria bicolor S238N-H82]|uniref:Predicted protein n=1 Tax=Laccaria bicolor (strain S238N-H82 / ATCC MYA-4686) TaxID=486041 RepID=B0DU23_LACBS|nr:uncharacterized protein LACBIDRAFT_332845 [Laccaria bicolor S238N-H82]EDR01828.1 predicted protein [Laccaria bicolor S238N-H82]|eukprot:XP_001887438.1 predicted protein [Laccaria bicolor S238N-H82]
MVSAPRLHSISWLSQKSYATLAFPWEQLTHFTLGSPTVVDEGLRILAICPHLKFLELILLPIFPVSNDGDPFVRHNTLQHLHLSVVGNMAALFDKVTLPALKDLSLSELHGTAPDPPIHLGRWPQSQFLAFLLRSGCTIEQFIIEECDISAEDLVECLAHPQVSKSLRSLSVMEGHLKNPCVTDEVLKRLTYTPLETICPNLTTIKLWGCISAQDGKVADMVESRWLPRTEGYPLMQLRTAVMGFSPNTYHADDRIRLGAFNVDRSGIKLTQL